MELLQKIKEKMERKNDNWQNIAVITLFSISSNMCKDPDGMTNSVDPDRTAPGSTLYCVPRPVCLNTLKHYIDSMTSFRVRILTNSIRVLQTVF